MKHGRLPWIRRVCFGAVLIAAAVTPGPAAGRSSAPCPGESCEAAGTVRWIERLPGAWVAANGLAGTTPTRGQAYAALGSEVAAVGAGMMLSAYSAQTGEPLWSEFLTGFPAGSAITAVRAWPGVLTVGIGLPSPAPAPGTTPAAGPSAAPQAGAPVARRELVLRAATGQQMDAYPAAPFGGAVDAGHTSAVIVGQRAVTSYSNRTGRVLWSRPTGSSQAWQSDGGHIYVAEAAHGYLGTAPVTAVRRIDLRTGRESVIRPDGHAFAGELSLAFGGAVLFSGADGVTAYSELTGERLWHRAGVLPDMADVPGQRLYLISGDMLLGVDPMTGQTLARVGGIGAGASSGLYAAWQGTVLGLDHGALGKAWGYQVSSQQVLWTSRPLPWPHYFADLSGLGGSVSPGQDGVLLAICGALGAALPGDAGQRCNRPEVAVINR